MVEADLQKYDPPIALQHFPPLVGCAVIWMRHCSRNKTLHGQFSVRLLHSPHLFQSCTCSKKQILRGQTSNMFLAPRLLAHRFPGRNRLEFLVGCKLWVRPSCDEQRTKGFYVTPMIFMVSMSNYMSLINTKHIHDTGPFGLGWEVCNSSICSIYSPTNNWLTSYHNCQIYI